MRFLLLTIVSSGYGKTSISYAITTYANSGEYAVVETSVLVFIPFMKVRYYVSTDPLRRRDPPGSSSDWKGEVTSKLHATSAPIDCIT